MPISKISIIIPAYNEAETLAGVIEKVESADFGQVEKELIIVDDGSRDGTSEIVRGFPEKYKKIFHPTNKGKGSAVISGIAVASGDYVIIQDADLEYDPGDIRPMIAEADKDNAPAVYGSRRLGLARKKNPRAGWLFYLGGVFLSWLTNILYGTKITDEPTGYKMIRKDVLDTIPLCSRGFEFCPEITAKLAKRKIPIIEVPISYHPRSKNEGKKIKLRDGLIAIWTLVKYRF